MAAISRRSLARREAPPVAVVTVAGEHGPERKLVSSWRAGQLTSTFPGERRYRRYRGSKAARVRSRQEEARAAHTRREENRHRLEMLKRFGRPLPGQPTGTDKVEAARRRTERRG